MLHKIISEEIIKIALEDLLSKKDSCGIDGIKVSEFQEYWELNGEDIKKLIITEQYQPETVLATEILKINGKKRTISRFTCTDRLILRAMKEVLESFWINDFSKYSYAYQTEKGVQDAVQQAAEFIQNGLVWVLELDISSYFDNINIEFLLQLLFEKIEDSKVQRLIKKYLYCWVESDYQKMKKKKGIVQGSPLSPLFSNIYLNGFDHYLENSYSFCRFSDNINLYFETREEAVIALPVIESYLKETYFLDLNQEKSGIYLAMNRNFLGYTFQYSKDKSKVLIFKDRKEKNQKYSSWHSSAIQRIGKDYHLINDGILTRKDYTILFENKTGKKYIPVETCDSINIYSNVIVGAEFFSFMKSKKVSVAFFDKYGEYIGIFNATENTRSVSVMMKQVLVYKEETKRVELAKKIELAALHNIRENLRYYYKKKKTETLEKQIQQMDIELASMKEADSIQEMMLIEARCHQKYFLCWDEIINQNDFIFDKRTRRPPRNALNALISFGNVFLYRKIAVEIYKSSLDIRIGILHSTNRRSESLNLDIAELFKPLIVDRTIFTMIHNKELNKDLHFNYEEDGGVYLNKEGKKKFIKRLEDKLGQKITVKGEQLTYHTLIRKEIQKIFKAIVYEESYKPYKYY